MNQPSTRQDYAVLIYRKLLFAYPPSFRRRYGAEMAQMFAACCVAARAQGRREFARLWLHTSADLFISAAREWAQVATAARPLANLRLALVVLLVSLLFELANLRLLAAS